jgi:predicted nucleotidyltransferase
MEGKKSIEEIKRIINRHKRELEEKFKVKRIGIFGSYVRNEQNETSDIDILVELKEPIGFLFIHLADFLEEILQLKVDLITPEAIKPNRQKYIMEEIIYV